jgi:YVTN family beta-propeller protein
VGVASRTKFNNRGHIHKNEMLNLRSNSSTLLGSYAAFTLSVLFLSAFSLYNNDHMAAGQSIGPTIAIDPSTNKIYVADPASGIVSVINGTTDTVARSIKIPVPAPISITLSINLSTNKIYVATHPAGVGGGMMFVITGSTNTIAKSFPIL